MLFDERLVPEPIPFGADIIGFVLLQLVLLPGQIRLFGLYACQCLPLRGLGEMEFGGSIGAYNRNSNLR